MNDLNFYGLGAALLLFEAIKWTINKIMPTDPLCSEDKFYLQDLHKMHSRCDDNGRPLWYVPSDIGINQREILDILKDISHSQADVARILEKLSGKF